MRHIYMILFLTSIYITQFYSLNGLLPKLFCQMKKAKDHLAISTLQAHERTSNSDAVDTHLLPCNVCTFEFWILTSWCNGSFSCCRNFRNTTVKPYVSLLWMVDYSNFFIKHHFDYILVPLFSFISIHFQMQNLQELVLLVNCWNRE
jgi:hypothetical protein